MNPPIHFDPNWEFDADSVESVQVTARFLKIVKKFHKGLTRATLTGTYKNADGAIIKDKVQVFLFPGVEESQPAGDPHTLAQLIWMRGNEHALKHKVLCTYRVVFYGSNPKLREDGNFQREGTFRIDARPDEDEEDEEETEDETEEDDTPVRAQRRQIPRDILRTGRRPNPALGILGRAGTSDIEGITQIVTGSLQSHVALASAGNEHVASVQAETRAALSDIRSEFSNMQTSYDQVVRSQQEFTLQLIQEQRANSESTVSALREELAKSREAADRANERLVEITEQRAAEQLGRDEVVKRGWDAFNEGMQAKMESVAVGQSWERVMMGREFQAMQARHEEEQKKKPKKMSPWMKDLAPLVAMGIGGWMSKENIPGGEQIIAGAIGYMGSEIPEDDDDEDEDEDDTIETSAAPKRESAEEFFDKHPLSAMAQLLGSLLEDKHRKALEKALPAVSWSALQKAFSSRSDAMTKSYLMQHVASIEDAEPKVKKVLNAEQRKLYKQLVGIVQKDIPDISPDAPPPPPPQPGDEE